MQNWCTIFSVGCGELRRSEKYIEKRKQKRIAIPFWHWMRFASRIFFYNWCDCQPFWTLSVVAGESESIVWFVIHMETFFLHKPRVLLMSDVGIYFSWLWNWKLIRWSWVDYWGLVGAMSQERESEGNASWLLWSETLTNHTVYCTCSPLVLSLENYQELRARTISNG